LEEERDRQCDHGKDRRSVEAEPESVVQVIREGLSDGCAENFDDPEEDRYLRDLHQKSIIVKGLMKVVLSVFHMKRVDGGDSLIL